MFFQEIFFPVTLIQCGWSGKILELLLTFTQYFVNFIVVINKCQFLLIQMCTINNIYFHLL